MEEIKEKNSLMETDYKNDFFNIDTNKLRILNKKAECLNANTLEPKCMAKLRTDMFKKMAALLKKSYDNLSAEIKSEYPFFSSLAQFKLDESDKAFVVAQFRNKVVHDTCSNYELYDTTDIVKGTVMKITETHPNKMKAIAEERDTLLEAIYKSDYQDTYKKQMYDYPNTSTKIIKQEISEELAEYEFKNYCYQRHYNWDCQLKPGPVLGFFLRKIPHVSPVKKEAQVNNNFLEKTLDLVNEQSYKLIIQSGIYPETPVEIKWDCTSTEKLVFASDIHVGSYTHCREDWLKLVEYVANKNNRVKYFILNGDLIEGVGVYPNQSKDLELKDYREQYKRLAQDLKGVPPEVNLIISLGNHDYISTVEPQNWDDNLKNLVKDILLEEQPHRKILFAPNPFYLYIEGLYVWASHGTGIYDTYSELPNFEIDKPTTILNYCVSTRLVHPIKSKTPVRLTEAFNEIIPEYVNIYTTGHVHAQDSYKRSKNELLLCTGTFQNVTAFQNLMHFQPTVSTAWSVTLNDPNSVTYLDFSSDQTSAYDFRLSKYKDQSKP